MNSVIRGLGLSALLAGAVAGIGSQPPVGSRHALGPIAPASTTATYTPVAYTAPVVAPPKPFAKLAVPGWMSREYFGHVTHEEPVCKPHTAAIRTLWERKASTGADEKVLAAGRNLVRSYAKSNPACKSIEAYIAEADSVVNTTRAQMNWSVYAAEFNLSPAALARVQRLDRITGEHLAGISLTEIARSKNSAANVQFFSYLLRSMGQSGIERIPSLHDKELSFGQYQLTPNAVGCAAGVAKALPQDMRPATDIRAVSGAQQHQVAYLHFLCAAASVVRRTDVDPALLSETARAEIYGLMHHSPRAAKQVLSQAIRYNALPSAFLSGDKRAYATKTASNVDALQTGLRPTLAYTQVSGN
jgi:hypothetical protein